MKIWFPTIRANTGADIFTINLAKGLRKNGIQTEITWLPHLAEVFPHSLRYIKAPNDIDIIHTNSWYGFSFSKVNRPMVISLFHWVHDPALSPFKSSAQKFYHKNFIKRYEYSSIENATAVIAISKYTGNQITKIFPDKKIHVINTGIDTTLFKPSKATKNKDQFKLIFVGTPSKRKGFDMLLPIMEQLPDNILLQYTDGFIKSSKKNIVKVGKLNLKNLIDYYQNSDAMLFPSRYEGFGYVIAEAMACAKPVISSDCSAIPELITNNQSGFLCPVGDVMSFADSVLRLVKDKDLCTRLGNEARNKVVQDFNIEAMVEKYIKVYKSLL